MGSPTQRTVALLSCGAFNPPTIMHLRLFELARDHFKIKDPDSNLIGVISPVHDAYGKKGLLPAQHRVEMARRAVAGRKEKNLGKNTTK